MGDIIETNGLKVPVIYLTLRNDHKDFDGKDIFYRMVLFTVAKLF
jgi:hypothetical protein